MLEASHYTGFSNFDIKVGDDPTDFRVFEINLRQGRSNFYVTASGMNIARLVVEKWNDGGNDCVSHLQATVGNLSVRQMASCSPATMLCRSIIQI